MKYLNIFFLFVLVIANQDAFAQNEEETPRKTFFLAFNGAASAPGADMADRFGLHGMAGLGFFYKTSSNWILGAEFDYMFGENVKEDDILDPIRTQNGFLIGTDGLLFSPALHQRGYKIQLTGGKILPVLSPNINSGLLITGSLGFLQHKISYFLTEEASLPQLSEELKKGYDRLSNGISISEFIGYYHMSESRLVNFKIGVELTQAFTQNRRSLNYDTMTRDDSNRLDLLFGLKASWILPFSSSSAKTFTY